MSAMRLGSKTVYPEPQSGLKTNPAATLFLLFVTRAKPEKKKKKEKPNGHYIEYKYKCAQKTQPPTPMDN